MGVISGPWGGRRVTILCFHVLCFQAVFSLSRPLVTHLRSSPRSVTNSHSWVTSHDTHADTPSISQSDLSLLMFDEVYACKKKKPWMLAWFWVWRLIPTSVHTTIMCITWKQAYICAPFYEYTSNKQLGHCSPAGHIFSPANEKGARLSPVFYCKETSMKAWIRYETRSHSQRIMHAFHIHSFHTFLGHFMNTLHDDRISQGCKCQPLFSKRRIWKVHFATLILCCEGWYSDKNISDSILCDGTYRGNYMKTCNSKTAYKYASLFVLFLFIFSLSVSLWVKFVCHDFQVFEFFWF